MPDTKISDFSDAGALTGTEIVPLAGGGANERTTTQTIANLGTGIATLAEASDVAITSPAANDILVALSVGSPPTIEWTNRRPHYAIAVSAPQVTAYTASQVLAHHAFACAVTVPANFGAHLGRTSHAGGSVNATASTVISVDKAAAASPNTFNQVGTITIASGGVADTLATSGGTAITFADGDIVRFVAPATPDTTFAGFYATVAGFQT